MGTLVIIAQIVGGLLALYLSILGIFVGHRYLLWHPARPDSVTWQVWNVARFKSIGIDWTPPEPEVWENGSIKPDSEPEA